jgi:limonene-1,2-epoxide hydrolase
VTTLNGENIYRRISTMEIRYNVTGDRRKELVKVISGITGAKAVYKFMPTCNYEIDYFSVTKDGTLLFDDRADSEEVERVLEGIAAAGFACEAPEKTTEEPEEAAQ